MIKLILAVILVPTLVVGAVVLFTPWLDNFIVDNIPRPQDPVERNYVISDVKFEGGDADVTLAGELTMPSSGGPFPAIIMITGSGPQDRNEQIMGHRPFLVFSDYMTKQGYAVLRYDDRGFAESTGDHDAATTGDLPMMQPQLSGGCRNKRTLTLQRLALLATLKAATSLRLLQNRSTQIF